MRDRLSGDRRRTDEIVIIRASLRSHRAWGWTTDFGPTQYAVNLRAEKGPQGGFHPVRSSILALKAGLFRLTLEVPQPDSRSNGEARGVGVC